jgi:hypothetical protein
MGAGFVLLVSAQSGRKYVKSAGEGGNDLTTANGC